MFVYKVTIKSSLVDGSLALCVSLKYNVSVMYVPLYACSHLSLILSFVSTSLYLVGSFRLGCCDVLSDIDVNTIKIMSELCDSLIERTDGKLRGPAAISWCRSEIYNKCGVDISDVLQEHIRLGRSFKQIVDEVRTSNVSLCLKYNYGVSPWLLGVPHKVTVNLQGSCKDNKCD